MSLEQSRQNETGWLDLMEQNLGEKRAAWTETSSQCKVRWSAGQLRLRALGNLRDVGAYPSFSCSEGQGIWSIYHYHPPHSSAGVKAVS